MSFWQQATASFQQMLEAGRESGSGGESGSPSLPYWAWDFGAASQKPRVMVTWLGFVGKPAEFALEVFASRDGGGGDDDVVVAEVKGGVFAMVSRVEGSPANRALASPFSGCGVKRVISSSSRA